MAKKLSLYYFPVFVEGFANRNSVVLVGSDSEDNNSFSVSESVVNDDRTFSVTLDNFPADDVSSIVSYDGSILSANVGSGIAVFEVSESVAYLVNDEVVKSLVKNSFPSRDVEYLSK